MNFQDVIRDVHDPVNHALQTSSGGATIFAVVNTGAAGVGNSIVTVANPNFGINAGVNGIGFATVNVVNQPALTAGVANIGFATVNISNPTIYAVVNTSAQSGQATVNINTGAAYIGLASVNIGGTLPALTAGVAGIGFATVNLVNQPALTASAAFIGITTAVNASAWPDPKTFVGLMTTVNASSTANIGSVSVLGGSISLLSSTLNIGSVSVLGGGIGLNAGVNGIGFATVKVAVGTQFIGLVTAVARNAGTNKTLVNLPIGFSVASQTTIAVPTNANTMYITNLLLNSNATTRITLKSGVTYLTGNASIGITLNPGGGLVMTGSPDSPSWIGLPSGALVIEKLDLTGTSAQLAGNVIYFQE